MSSDSSEPRESSEHGTTCSRRAFLAGTATVAAGAMASTPATAQSPSQPHADDWPEEFVVNPTDGNNQFTQPGRISREGYRLLAGAEYRAQQQGNVPTFSKRVHAVEDLGLDPTGGEPVQDKIANAAEPGMLIVCPRGSKFRATDHLIVNVDGPFGIVGEGYEKSTHPPGPDDKNAVIFDIDNDGPTIFAFNTPSGMFANWAVDQRGKSQTIGLKYQTNGYILGRDLRTIGPQSSKYPQGSGKSSPALASVTSDNATVRINRYTNVGGGESGTKESSGQPIIWAGASHHGTLQLIDCHVANSADNGAYCGRTPGDVQVFRGLWQNNDVSQVRLSGKGSRVDGAEIVLDEKNYTGLGTKKGFPSSNGIKWDGKPTRENGSGGKIVNCDIRGLSEAGDKYGVGSLIAIFSTAGAVTIENTRLVCKVDATPISAQPPDGNSYPPPPQPHRVIVQKSVVTGPTAGDGGALTIRNRPNSLVSDTCLKYPSASSGDISGAKTSNVGYGSCKPSQGLSAPKKVGGSGSGLPPVNVSYSGVPGSSGSSGRDGPSKGVLVAVVDGIFMLLFILFGMVVLFIVGIVGALGALAAMIGGD